MEKTAGKNNLTAKGEIDGAANAALCCRNVPNSAPQKHQTNHSSQFLSTPDKPEENNTIIL